MKYRDGYPVQSRATIQMDMLMAILPLRLTMISSWLDNPELRAYTWSMPTDFQSC